MNALTPHSAQRASSHHAVKSHPGGEATSGAVHPERAAVLGHLKRLTHHIAKPGMADHPLTASEGNLLREGANDLNRAANTAS